MFLQVKDEVEGIVTGALASEYQKQRIDALCEELGLKSIAPLWQKMQSSTGGNCSALVQALEELKKLSKKYRFHLGFEGGRQKPSF